MKYAVGLIAALAVVAAFFFGCQGCSEQATYVDQWYAGQSIDELVTEYHNQIFPTSTPAPNSRRSLYIDFSSGIQKAFENSELNKDYLDGVIAKAYGQGSFDFFRLLNGDTVRMPNDQEKIAQTVFDPTSYQGIFAPIQEAIEKLASEGRSGIVVSDWEDYSRDKKGAPCNPEKVIEPFCVESFTSWLNDGGRIEFRYLPRYNETNRRTCNGYEGASDKHLYFAFFIAEGDDAMVSMLSDLDARWEENHDPASQFALHQGMKAGYRNDSGGLTQYLSQMGFLRREIDGSTELISVPFPMDKGLVDTHLIKALGMQNNPEDNDYWNKGIVFDSEQNELFKVTGLDIQVSDATRDFASYLADRMLSNYATVGVAPILTTDVHSKAQIWDSLQVTQLMLNCFEENTATVKKQYAFAPSAPSEVKQVFEMAEGSIEQLTNDPGNVELNLKSSSELDPNQLVCDSHGKLLRVDYVVPKKGFKDVRTDALNDFAWESLTEDGVTNESLRKSISITAESCGPDDAPDSYILYTQYFALNTPGFARNITDVVLPPASSN